MEWENPVLPLLTGPAIGSGAIVALGPLFLGALFFSHASVYGPRASATFALVVIGGAIATGVAYGRHQLLAKQRCAPGRIRICEDRVVGFHAPGRVPNGVAAVVELPFGENTLIRTWHNWWNPPAVANLGDLARAMGRTGPGPGPPRIALLLLTPENILRVQGARHKWLARPHVSDDQRVAERRTLPGASAVPTFGGRSESVGHEPVRWLDNTLAATIDGKIVTQRLNPGHHVRRIGLGDSGVYLPKLFGGIRTIPWPQLCGPSLQSFGDFWNVTPSRPDGSPAIWSYIVVNQGVAEALASHPKCPRRNMVRSDLRRLGLSES